MLTTDKSKQLNYLSWIGKVNSKQIIIQFFDVIMLDSAKKTCKTGSQTTNNVPKCPLLNIIRHYFTFKMYIFHM